jgi:hypothetical protein
MKFLKKITFAGLLIINTVSFSQIKIDNLGHVGIGTAYPNSGYQTHIIKNILVSNTPGTTFNQMWLLVGNGAPGAEIGTSNGTLAIWASGIGYNNVFAKDFYRQSDSTLKSNIINIENGLSNLMKLKPVHYNIKNSKFINESEIVNYSEKQYGFLSQDIEKSLSDVNITKDYRGVKLMDYDQIIPLSVKAIQEQQAMITELEEEIQSLKIQIENINHTSSLEEINSSVKSTYILQNRPNPFNKNTIIEYVILQNYKNGAIVIFDMNGELIKNYKIENNKKGEINISADELKPGKYIYSLILDGIEIDSKKMILLGQ